MSTYNEGIIAGASLEVSVHTANTVSIGFSEIHIEGTGWQVGEGLVPGLGLQVPDDDLVCKSCPMASLLPSGPDIEPRKTRNTIVGPLPVDTRRVRSHWRTSYHW